jgi:pilus assembly protein CpaB
MKKRLISVFVFALTVSAGAAFVLYQLIATRVTAGAAASRASTKTVFVAAHDLTPGALVTANDITQQSYISVPEGAITKKEDIINRGVIMAIHKEAPFFEGTLAKAGEGAGFATIIPAGMRAFTVKVNEVVGVAGFAVAGMHVDVLIAGTPPNAQNNAGPISRTLLQTITVLSAGQNYQKDAEGKPVLVQVVNLLLTPEQSEIMNLATDQRIQLVLRNPTDQVITKTTGAATANLFDGGAIRPPVPPSSGVAREPKRRPDPPPAAAGASGPVAPRRSTIEVLSGGARKSFTVDKVDTGTTEVAR